MAVYDLTCQATWLFIGFFYHFFLSDISFCDVEQAQGTGEP